MSQDPRSSITVVRLKERQFLIPTEVLRRCCPALRRQLPSSNATITHLELSGIPEATFETLVYYFRTGRAPELNIQNVIDVFCTASDLGIRPLEKKCWKHVFKTMSRQEQSLLLLVESERGLHMTRDDTLRLMDVLVKNFRKTVNSAAFLQLSERQVRHLLTYPPLRNEHGINATYKAAMRWLHADCRARHGYVERLTSALGDTPDPSLTEKLTICPTIAREVSKLSLESPSPPSPKLVYGISAMNEAKVNVKQPESNIEAKPEFPAEPIVAETAPQSKAAETQLKSPFSHPKEKFLVRVDERPKKGRISRSIKETRASKRSSKEKISLRNSFQETSQEHDFGRPHAREKRIVGLVGGRTEPSPKASELQRVTKSRHQEYELNFRTPSRTARIPTYLKLTRGRSWQRKPDGEREIDSSLTNAEREPSKRRRSLDEARLKFKRDRENGRRILQTSGRRMHDDYYEWSTVGSRQRGVHYQHRTNTHGSKPYMHESEPYIHYSANSSDMAIPKFSRKSKSRRPSNQSATLKKVENFDLTEESAKQALRGGRYDQRHVAGSTADTKISEAKIFDKTAILKPKTKVRLKDKAGRKKIAYNITIKDNISQKSRRRSMKLPRTPNVSGAESYASTMRNKKSCRPVKVTQSFLRSGRHGRPSKPNPATVTGKRYKKGKCVIC